ncbi:serpin family protein [Ornithinimicrobium cerasi]|uniref:Serine protease inhibitor n=1 Tax=Ornithinimicrobium cerasi TaxID=2248773 RepID=A0A285VLB4_9MICO|nr:serpin family protein [Ornithinimicrobium cerasi]SOC54872.1 Serine protease inhibitor [Ornithinimicrobium cerasi]
MRRRREPLSTGLVSVGLIAVLAATACGAQPAPTQLSSDQARVVVDPSEAVALPRLVAAADAMALDLVAAAGDVTTVTSPASLQVALSMAAEGAEGQTLSELESLIGATGQERTEGMNALTGALADLDGDPAVVQEDELPEVPVVHRASRLLVDDSLAVKQSFVDALARSYDAPAQTADLAGGDGRVVLDAWVDEHTGGLVPRSAIVPGPELRLVVQDAIVLAARWEQPFLAEVTRPHPFTLPSGEEVEVDMMSSGGYGDTAYVQVEGWQGVRLPYTGGRLSADVILPPPGSSPLDLGTPVLEQLLGGLDTQPRRPLLLRMPVVDARSTLDLMSYLGDRVPSSLEGGFGGITDQEQLVISQAAQQGVLVIDEDGTLAAALTEVGAAGSAPLEPPLELVVDRPYLVRVSDARTGWTLFLAYVADPRGER